MYFFTQMMYIIIKNTQKIFVRKISHSYQNVHKNLRKCRNLCVTADLILLTMT